MLNEAASRLLSFSWVVDQAQSEGLKMLCSICFIADPMESLE